MELLKIDKLSFTYPASEKCALDGVSFDVRRGELLLLCGKSGSGKSTLLRLIKREIAPVGRMTGDIYLCGKKLSEMSERESATQVGLVFQNPDTHIVTETVGREMAFGLENLSMPSEKIRRRVAEMASYFGLCEDWNKETCTLSGGKKQLLCLASAMSCDPELLLLDEPTSRLDPIAAEEFISSLLKLKNELGLTIIISEHRLESLLPASDRVIMLEDGKVAVDAPTKDAVRLMAKTDMLCALPTPTKVGLLLGADNIPLTVAEGVLFIRTFAETLKKPDIRVQKESYDCKRSKEKPLLEVCSVDFRYSKTSENVLRRVNAGFYPGQIYAVLGANGAGKSTLLSCLSGLEAPTAGKIKYLGKNMSGFGGDLWKNNIAMLMQDAQLTFCHDKVSEDLEAALKRSGNKPERLEQVCRLMRIENLVDKHPYDLSGGELQRAALAKLLVGSPKVLMLDEPTQGLDAFFKRTLAEILCSLSKEQGVCVIMVSHDLEFAACCADSCALMFDGTLSEFQSPADFFPGNRFYTTATCRIMRNLIPSAVCFDDIKRAFDERSADIETCFEESGEES